MRRFFERWAIRYEFALARNAILATEQPAAVVLERKSPDKRLMAALTSAGTVGFVFGIVTSSSAIGAAVAGLVYGIVGALIAVPVAFAIKRFTGLRSR